MQGVFLDRASLDCGDLDFSPLDAILPDWRYTQPLRRVKPGIASPTPKL